MEELNKLKDTVAQLERAIEKIDAAATSQEVNAADSEIGACLRSIQYGVGMVGIECKHFVEDRQRAIRGLALQGNRLGWFVDKPVEPTTEEPVVSKTQMRKAEIVKKAKKTSKRGKK